MQNLNPEIFQAFQNKLKTGNRRGVHLNAIPGSSRYKFDLARLSEIHKSLPEHFIIHLLTQKTINFKFSIHDKISDEVAEAPLKDRIYLSEDVSEEQPEPIGKNKSKELVLEKLSAGLENLIFQNEVIQSEKGINSLGFGFPILIRKDMDGQISASPILIWSVNIKPVNELNTWEISRTEDDPIYVNEVLINHLQSDSGITLEQIPEEMLADGKIDKPELLQICQTLLDQLKISQNLDFILNNYEEIPLIKSKASYEDQLQDKGDAVIIKSGVFSIFEVQKQNIINDYESLKKDFKPLENYIKEDFQSITSIETDPSQQAILESLKSQTRILIQGPPGTGKSQTLTAVLVNALENRQKTIVVCEKQTALEVLYNALHKLGLERYCIMIKDSVSDRKLVVDAVRNTIDPADFKKPGQLHSVQLLQEQLRAIDKHKAAINNVHEILNSDILPGKNWTELVGYLLAFQKSHEDVDIRDIRFSFSADEGKDIAYIVEKGKEVYQEYRPFEQRSFINPEKLIRENFHNSLHHLDFSFQKYEKLWDEIQMLIGQFKPVYEEKRKRDFSQNFQKLSSLIDETEVITSVLSQSSEEFHPEITSGFFYKFTALFSASKKKKISNQKKLLEISASIKQISLNEFFPSIELSDNLWNNKNEILKYRQKIQNLQAEFSSKLEEQFNTVDFLNVFDPVVSGIETEAIARRIKELKKCIVNDQWVKDLNFGNTYESFDRYLISVLDRYRSYRNDPDNPLSAEYNWFYFYQPLSTFQKKVLEKLYPVNNWRSSFYSAYFPLLLNHSADPKLNFNERNYEEISKQIKQYGFSQKDFIQYFWNESRQNAVKQFEQRNKEVTVANLYNKRSSTNHKRLTLRQMVQKDTDLFTSFFPIILITPDACSNLFQGKNFYFDHVIFDEASQLKLEDNLPAMLKGKNIIIAGDEHQMPPSNYFSKVFEGIIEDEDDMEAENDVVTYKNALLNIESLLDYAAESHFEKNHLDFHYRSKHPYLIDFSNHAFYNSRLKPLPIKSETLPIEFFQVDGVFEDHTNKQEADKVLEILQNIQPMKDGNYPSVGIATFNITQRNYIKRKIVQQTNLPGNERFKDKILGLEAAGLFIKNLENIQGDERDIIIVSATYGRKTGGKFIQSFGPINHTKGYKLLNVIITRAKEKIYICNSVPEEIFSNYKEALVQEGSNNRKAVLYAYLAYCKAVSEGNDSERIEILNTLDQFGYAARPEENKSSSVFIDEIYNRVQRNFLHLNVLKNHRFGGYEFDILVENKDGKSVVIEAMSKAKYSGNLGYLEDLHKEKIVRNAGFKYVRIWSQNCWQNLEAELQKINKKIV
ncbi:AAA domain-containing protein [Chryseobacterium sp. SSA4.19]|uniref:AAA domain-containing protein n=1 Tax=Chryseobacterium sp. SSA4.19 TaxID=2919915 RepID=UPI001F4DC5C1|nr:AAA domain-containing protein [Chryseobacterium sp. SSA4.19]MCJ8153291.1 AAA domain-containing protein [Chryseobacterium sp. SSA4.19]